MPLRENETMEAPIAKPSFFTGMCHYPLRGSYTVIYFMSKNLMGRKPLTGQQNRMHNEADANGAVPFCV